MRTTEGSRTATVVTLVLLLTCLKPTSTYTATFHGPSQITGFCYRGGIGEKTWQDCKTLCKDLGLRMPRDVDGSIHEEIDYIANAAEIYPLKTWASEDDNKNAIWTGYKFSPYAFAWSDDTTRTNANMYGHIMDVAGNPWDDEGQPSYEGDATFSNICAAIQLLTGDKNAKLNDLLCTETALCACVATGNCSVAADVPNANREGDGNGYGEALTYTCAPGYVMADGHGGAVTCQCDGQWSARPTCVKEKATCTPPTINNGQVTNAGSVEEGETLAVQCDDGHQPDSVVATCGSDGKFASLPTCSEEKATCTPPTINNGEVTNAGSVEEGETLTVQCDDGYQLDSVVATCGSDGKFASLPTCSEEKATCTPPTISNGQVTNAGSVEEGETLTVQCRDGYQLGSVVATCGSDGKFTSLPICSEEKATCSPPIISNANVTDTGAVEEGGTLVVQCDAGYQLDNVVATCGSDGKFASLPGCRKACNGSFMVGGKCVSMVVALMVAGAIIIVLLVVIVVFVKIKGRGLK